MQRILNYLIKNRKWIGVLLMVTGINTILNVGVIVAENLAHHEELEWSFYVINEFTGTFTILLLIPFLIKLFESIPLKRPYFIGKVFLYLLVTVIFGFIYTSIMYAARIPLYGLVGITRLHEIFNELPYRYLMEYFKQFFSFWLVYIVYLAISGYQKNREKELAESELKEALLKAQLQNLQAQLHPHFFFNTLNTISSVMYDDPGKADRIITLLSEFLRKVIGLKEKHLHSLGEEMELLKKYTDIMLARYPDKLSIIYEVEKDALSEQVPVLFLQPILENAIQNSVDFKEKAIIYLGSRIEPSSWSLRIRDNGPGIQEGALTFGTGLSNTINRLQKLFNEDYEFELKNRKEGGLDVLIGFPKTVQNAL